jgi:hypothetical protein
MTNPYGHCDPGDLRSGLSLRAALTPTANRSARLLPVQLLHRATCRYFATAMGDMLRSLGIRPAGQRLRAGAFGTARTASSSATRMRTRGSSYFPGYGWIPFEPTNDGTYFTIPRISRRPQPLLRDSSCDTPPGRPGRWHPVVPNPAARAAAGMRAAEPGSSPPGFHIHIPMRHLAAADRRRPARLLLLFGRWWRATCAPHGGGGLETHARAGEARRADVQPGETLELAGSRVFPEAAPSVRALAGNGRVAPRRRTSRSRRASVMEAWTSLWPLMLRRVAGRFRPGRTW